jgi:hypothetical protein
MYVVIRGFGGWPGLPSLGPGWPRVEVFVGAINGDGDRLPGQEFGLATAAWYQTGLGGSPGTGGMESTPLAEVSIVPVYQSSQGDPDRVQVGVGDTFSSSSDTAVVVSPLVPPMADSTGMGKGHVI